MLRPMVLLKNTTEPKENEKDEKSGKVEDQQQLKRVLVQASDMDWLFKDNNARLLLSMLANDANPLILKMKPVKMFIEILWTEYQPLIIRMVFAPYILYLLCIYQLTGSMLGRFLTSCAQRNEKVSKYNLDKEDIANFFSFNSTK